MHDLIRYQAPPEILAAATGGTWAGYRNGEIFPAEVRDAVSATARALIVCWPDDSLQALGSSCLALMADVNMTENPSADFVLAATAALRLEHYRLAVWAARSALRQPQRLTREEIDQALGVLARVTHGTAGVSELQTWREESADHRALCRDNRIFREPRSNNLQMVEAARAMEHGDRVHAARLLAKEIERIDPAEDAREIVEGTSRAFRALAEQPVPAATLREALQLMLRHLRTRQRFGQESGMAMSGVSMVIKLTMCTPSLEAANVLAELVEALADAGLAEIESLPGAEGHAAVLHARLRRQAQRAPLWPDMRACIDGLEGRPAVLFRYTGRNAAAEYEVLRVEIEPPARVGLVHLTLSAQDTALIDAFASGDPQAIAAVPEIELSRLLDRLIPDDLVERGRCAGSADLVVVPDGPLWSLPWHAARQLGDRNTLLAPSLSTYARLKSGPVHIRTVTAILDDRIPQAQIVRDALLAEHTADTLEVRFARTPADLDGTSDCLLVYGHGNGSGLEYGTTIGMQPFRALDLANISALTAIIATCWSSRRPPSSLPVNLPAAMLLGGFVTVIGGLWPLPVGGTARTLAAMIRALGIHGNPARALAEVRAAPLCPRRDHLGLAIHGKADGDDRIRMGEE